MRKLFIASLLVSGAAVIGWQNRIDLLVWAMPKLTALSSPVAPNRPVNWSVGPKTPALPADQRPPNIVLIMTDDMGFNDISLYNGGAADGRPDDTQHRCFGCRRREFYQRLRG
jgi:uncharacterized sulfatase